MPFTQPAPQSKELAGTTLTAGEVALTTGDAAEISPGTFSAILDSSGGKSGLIKIESPSFNSAYNKSYIELTGPRTIPTPGAEDGQIKYVAKKHQFSGEVRKTTGELLHHTAGMNYAFGDTPLTDTSETLIVDTNVVYVQGTYRIDVQVHLLGDIGDGATILVRNGNGGTEICRWQFTLATTRIQSFSGWFYGGSVGTLGNNRNFVVAGRTFEPGSNVTSVYRVGGAMVPSVMVTRLN